MGNELQDLERWIKNHEEELKGRSDRDKANMAMLAGGFSLITVSRWRAGEKFRAIL